jgi:hypothetical protein
MAKDRKDRKKNASNQSGGTWDEEDGVDLSTAAELWSEDELRELIREEALKLLGAQQSQPSIGGGQIYPYPPQQPYPSYPQPIQWTQTGTSNQLNDGHGVTVTNCSDSPVMAMA